MKNLVVIIIGVFISLPLMAREYGEAGCGLGSMLFHKDNQIFASTTNGSFGTQTFGISSGTSNCTDGGTVKSEAKVQLFIEANRLALAKDISRGQGEALNSLTKLLDCQTPIGIILQKQYDMIFPNDGVSAKQMSESIRLILRHSTIQCQFLG